MAATLATEVFPRVLGNYAASAGVGLAQVLAARIAVEPFNLVATGIFAAAIGHTFAVKRFQGWAHRLQERHDQSERAAGRAPSASAAAELVHFVGEVEVVLGLWAGVLAAAIAWHRGWATARHYLCDTVDYTEALFVFVVMVLASTRPILVLAERILDRVARLGRRTPKAWWLAVLTVGPFLG